MIFITINLLFIIKFELLEQCGEIHRDKLLYIFY